MPVESQTMSMPDFEHSYIVVVGGIEKIGVVTQDSGGLTKDGISQKAYPKLDIANLTPEQAKDIYLTDYWQAAHCDNLPWPLSMFVFDSAVNQGVEKAVRLVQRAVGVPEDGFLGPNSMAAIAKLPLSETCSLFMARRALEYGKTKDFATYGKGWLKRLFVVALSATK
jgi:lysozyme family protein